MAITWRHLVGSTDRFAIEVSLIPDPDEGRYATPEMAESWGELRIFVEGKSLCEARDPTGIVLDGVRWYLLPVLRFFLQNWEMLLHRGRIPFASRTGTTGATQMASRQFPPTHLGVTAAADWSETWWQFFSEHCLASARDGGVFPNVWFRRIMDDVEISWDNETNPAEVPLRFLDRAGGALVPAKEFAEVVGGILRATVDELSRRLQSAELMQLRSALDRIALPDEERRWLRQALLLDLRRNVDEAVALAKQLAAKFPRLGLSPQEDLFAPATLPSLVFASAVPNIAEQDAVAILREFEASEKLAGPTRLSEIEDEVSCPFGEAWRSGHELGLRLREKLSLGIYDPVEIAEVLEELGISVREIELSDRSIRAVSFVDDGVRPTVLVNTGSPRTRRVWSRAATLAHELCHLAFDCRVGVRLGVASGPWAPVRFEQRANAFAVMFLMPEPAVVEIFGGASGDLGERAKAVAQHFGASYRAAVEHLANLGLIEREERDLLLEFLDESML